MNKTYDVIVADPPWQYRVTGDGLEGTIKYATMPYEDIAAIPVADWAADPCVLACWTTWPKLKEGIRVCEAWGFEHVTGAPWVKVLRDGQVRTNVGFWFLGASELLLVAVRGSPRRLKGVTPRVGLLCGGDRHFYSLRGAHSAKPEGVQDYLEELFPDARYLELFARRERPGWDCWGGELGWLLSERGVEQVAAPERDEQLEMF